MKMKYETPQIEFTRFKIQTQIMTVVLPGGDDDKNDPTVPIGGDDWMSIPDLDPGDL